MDKNKKFIFNFIKNTFQKYTFERIQDSGLMTHNFKNEEVNNFEDFKDFMQHQYDCISKLDDNKATIIVNICQMIQNKEIKLCDEQSCAEFTANTIYWQRGFNRNGQIDESKHKFTIMNPR